MPLGRTRLQQKPNMKFYQRLTLNQWVWNQFGVSNLEELTQEIKKRHLEEIDDEGVTGFVRQWILSYPEAGRQIKNAALMQYDLNIVTSLYAINENREEKIRLKYFQWLSLMFVEFYLDSYFNNREALLVSLNDCRERFSSQTDEEYGNAEIPPYIDSDLNKVALWNATGSGKTFIMHINHLQYLHYGELAEGASFILLTPKEGLSVQHIDDYLESGIDAAIYDKNELRYGTDSRRIIILENTKLADRDSDKKDSVTVSVKRFGSQNVLFVDEGHRGSSGDTWQKYRDDLCNEGFSFEYSATFGQAAESSGDRALFDRYAKCILFDYSYKFFYKDGYGKDYNIINLQEDGDSQQRRTYLTACLLTFYQQKRLFSSSAVAYEPFNIENPLFVFVGSSVNAVRTEQGRKVSDVVDILLFFKDFLEDKPSAIRRINSLLSGTSGLTDDLNRNIFAGAFPYLTETGMSADEIYTDMIVSVFNSSSNAAFHIEKLNGVSGEIQLRLGNNPPFGVINVGDDSELIKLCASNGFDTGSVMFSGGSLFQGITKAGSPINLLIGAKKFTEGWNCWRVSTMGLMNVGRSEGSEIIQLFGRGVRLKGYGMSLKRSKAWQNDSGVSEVPRNISLLETLNVFGVRADYMKQFKEFLKREGVPSDKSKPVTIYLPVINNLPNRVLKTIRLKDDAKFKTDAPKPVLMYEMGIGKVSLDCYARLQYESSDRHITGSVRKSEGKIPNEAVCLMDIEYLWVELVRYKKRKGKSSLTIQKASVEGLLSNSEWYTLYIPESELTCSCLADIKRLERISLTLLQKYLDRYYYVKQNNWESSVVGYEFITLNEDMFPKDHAVTTTDGVFALWLKQVAKELKEFREKKMLPTEKTMYPLEVFSVSEHLHQPLIYNAENGVEIYISPVALNTSEMKFVRDLSSYVLKHNPIDQEIYLLRNQSKAGVGFFNNSGFYPDFILWVVSENKQSITFVDPHGMRNEGINSTKVRLASVIKSMIKADDSHILNSIILSPTSFTDMQEYGVSKADWKAVGVFFMEDAGYIEEVLIRSGLKVIAPDNILTIGTQECFNQRFKVWLQNQGLAARGDVDRQTLREIFDAMDDNDK